MIESFFVVKKVAGLDLAKDSIHACILGSNDFRAEDRFGTTLVELIRLKAWLLENSVEQVVMENTGIYTEPIEKILSEHFQTITVNAADVKRANKKKTDPVDAWWLAQLLFAGAIGDSKQIHGSHIPDETQSTLRELTRSRSKLVEESTTHKNRILKLFAKFNCKLPDVFGEDKFTLTALQIYEVVSLNLSCVESLPQLTEQQQHAKGLERGRITRTINFITGHQEQLEKSLKEMTVKKFPRAIQLEFLANLKQLELLIELIDVFSNEIKGFFAAHKDYQDQLNILLTIPGMGENTAATILAELPPVARFATGQQVASYAGLTPRISQSAESTKLGPITKRGSSYLRKAFFQAAQVASMRKNTRLGKKFQQLYKRKGKGKGKQVWVAIARTIATIVHALLTRMEPYAEERFVKKAWKQTRQYWEQKSIQKIAEVLRSKGYNFIIENRSTGVSVWD